MKTKICICTIFSFLLLTSCSGGAVEPTATPVDIGAIQTSVAETVVASITQTVAAYTPTPELTGTPTLTPTLDITETPTPNGTPKVNICDNLAFVSDSTVPDNTIMTAGQEFVKTWKVKNTGSCTWTTGYKIIFAYSPALGGQSTALTAPVLPGTEAEVSITLKAPLTVGTYKSFYRLSNNNNYPFGEFLSVIIIVQ